MIRSKGDEELELWLNRATDPSQSQENSEAITKFTQQVTKELEGPQIALRLLAHKIQSPMEKEALYALTVTESCVRHCGPIFHQELGKFRFLNEMIKIISPKYLGSASSDTVRNRCIELLYSWSKGLYTEPKIKEAYEVLKKQGLITKDPTYVDQALQTNPYLPLKRETQPSAFQDSKTSQELNRLLKSKKPEDLIAANRLIKGMVKQDTERMEKLSLKLSEMETIKNNIQLLTEMLNHYQPNETGVSDIEIIQELYKNVEAARLKLFKFASETDEKQDIDSLNEILSINDSAGEILKRCKDTIGADRLQQVSASSSNVPTASSSQPAAQPPPNSVQNLIGSLDYDPFDPLSASQSAASAMSAQGSHNNARESLLDMPPSYDFVLNEKGANDQTPVSLALAAAAKTDGSNNSLDDLLRNARSSPTPGSTHGSASPVPPALSGDRYASVQSSFTAKPQVPNLSQNKNKQSTGSSRDSANAKHSAFKDLDILGKELFTKSKVQQPPKSESPTTDTALLDLGPTSVSPSGNRPNESPAAAASFDFSSIPVLSLTNLSPHPDYSPQPILQAIPNQSDPKACITVTLHFTSSKPSPRICVLLCVMTSSLQHSCSGVKLIVNCKKDPSSVFQQEATSDAFGPTTPFVPPSPISSCILVHEPDGKNLTFQLSYNYDGQVKTAKSLGITLPDDLLD